MLRLGLRLYVRNAVRRVNIELVDDSFRSSKLGIFIGRRCVSYILATVELERKQCSVFCESLVPELLA